MGTESHGSRENIWHLFSGFCRLLFSILDFKDSRAAKGDLLPLSDGPGYVQKPIYVLHEALNKCQPINQRSFAMRKPTVALLLIFVFGVCGAYAQDKYSVSGTIRCVGTADVLISLSTHEEWVSDKEPVFSRAIKLTEEQKKAGKVSFKFEGVPKGRYALLAFQDIDENGKLDRNSKGTPLEPVGTYRPSFLHMWSAVNFAVDQDTTLPDIMLISVID